MAASYANANWDLGAARRGQDYRVTQRNQGLAGDSQNWVNAVVASSNRAASQNTAATSAGASTARAGLEGVTTLGATAMRANADLSAASLTAATSAHNSKTQADALIEREKVARGSDTLQYIKLAGGLGLTAMGLATM